MDNQQINLLRWLIPELGEVPLTNRYWMERAKQAIATSTQDRETFPVVDYTRGRGVWIYDIEGNEYLDMTSGIAVRALGLRPEGMSEFERRLGDVIEELPGHDFDNIPQTLLAERLNGLMPGDFPKQTFFTTSGARTIETAMKAAMDQTGRERFIAFRPAFHGRTGYALALTASKAVQKNGYPQGVDVVRTPYAYPYRCPVGSDPESCAAYALDRLREALLYEATDIAAIVVESVSGEGGIIVPPPQFLRGLRAIADELGAVLVADEVQAGLGRTGKWWGIEHAGVVPDMICTAKALGGGWPLGATIGKAPMFAEKGRHAETFSAEPRAALLSLFVLKQIEERGLIAHAAALGDRMLARFREMLGDVEQVGDIRGLGLMQGIEFVTDRASKRAAPDLRDRIVRRCVDDERLWIVGAGRSSIRFLPALTTTEEEAMEAIARFTRAVRSECRSHAAAR